MRPSPEPCATTSSLGLLSSQGQRGSAGLASGSALHVRVHRAEGRGTAPGFRACAEKRSASLPTWARSPWGLPLCAPARRTCAPHLRAAHPASPTVGRTSCVQPPPLGPALAERLAHSISSGEESFSPTGLQAPGEGKICISTFTSLDLNTMPSTESGS